MAHVPGTTSFRRSGHVTVSKSRFMSKESAMDLIKKSIAVGECEAYSTQNFP